MTFDAAIALRMVTNSRLRNAQGWCEFRDLGGALCSTSDAPIPELNCLGDFATDAHRIEGLLDVGFSLLRMFDCEPAAEVSPLDRPRDVEERLGRRGLRRHSARSWMRQRVGAPEISANDEVQVRVVGPDDARTFASVHGGSERWVRKLSTSSSLTAMHDGGSTFYLGYLDGEPVGTAHLLIDGATAGIYAAGTLRSYRRRGVCSTLMARAVADAREAGCDVVCLSTDAGGSAEHLYGRLGFETVFESVLWLMPERREDAPAAKRPRRRPKMKT